MIKRRKLFRYLNLILFLLFALATEIIVCMPLFEGANVPLQLAWTGGLFVGMCLIFFLGGKIAASKSSDKYLANSKKGTRWLERLLFIICIGAGAVVRLQKIMEESGAISAKTGLNLLFYFATGLLVYFIVKQISGFGGAVAATVFLVLCPVFDFSAGLSVKMYGYILLSLFSILVILLVNSSVEKRGAVWWDFLLTILGAIVLSGATFLHISAIAVAVPCALLLARKSGVEGQAKAKERRGMRCVLFLVSYACFSMVSCLLYTMEMQNLSEFQLPLDSELLHTLSVIGKEPETAILSLFDKISRLFAGGETSEYCNGILMGILVFGILQAILLFRRQKEKKYFPVYLFNWFFLGILFLEDFRYSRLLLFLLFSWIAAGTLSDLAAAVIAGKKKDALPEPEFIVEPEATLTLESVAEPEETLPPEPVTELEEVQIEEVVDGETFTEENPAEEISVEENPVDSVEENPVDSVEGTSTEEVVDKEEVLKELPAVCLEQQIQELLKREEMILGIVEKQNIRLSKLEEELRKQRLIAKQRERRYRQELAIARNKNRKK